MVALIVSWFFGASAFVEGCRTISFYRDNNNDAHDYVVHVRTAAERTEAMKVAENYLSTMYNAQKRVFPLAVAGMLLGAVMVGFSARAMSGRAGARGALIQIVSVQAALVIGAHVLTADVRYARAAIDALIAAQLREAVPDAESMEKSLAVSSKMFALGETIWLVLRSMASTLIVVALTRSRSRRFFEAAEGRFSER